MGRAQVAALSTVGIAGLLLITACGESQDTAVSTASSVSSASAAPATAVPGRDGNIIDPGDGGRYVVEIDPATFTDVIDNPYLPLRPGWRWEYEERSPDGEVEDHRRGPRRDPHSDGVDAVVVHDQARRGSCDIIEDTFDWYAQDTVKATSGTSARTPPNTTTTARPRTTARRRATAPYRAS
ncbi:MAG: hypothetical protein R2761_19750 [Acidimicrobiales bacterium]